MKFWPRLPRKYYPQIANSYKPVGLMRSAIDIARSWSCFWVTLGQTFPRIPTLPD